MADYFFFHGEGNIAEKGKNIRQAIRDILGFSLAETAIDDLKAMESSIRSDMRKISKDKDLQEIQSKLIDFSESLENLQNRYRELEPQASVHDVKISQLETVNNLGLYENDPGLGIDIKAYLCKI